MKQPSEHAGVAKRTGRCVSLYSVNQTSATAALQVIKALVFFNTFVFANTIFFATQFGPHSCFFSRTGFQGSVPLSWWVSASKPNPNFRA